MPRGRRALSIRKTAPCQGPATPRRRPSSRRGCTPKSSAAWPRRPALLHSINEAGVLVTVSDAWLAKLGYRREEALGRPSVDFLTPESRARAIRDVLPAFFQTGVCESVQYQMVKKDGGVIDVLMSAVLADDPLGGGRISLAVVTDITALLNTKRLLVESEAQYRSLVEDQTDLVSLAAPDGRLRFVNHAYAAFYGRRPEEMVGKSLFDFVPCEDHPTVADHLRQVCEARQGLESKNEVMMANGERRWFAWTNRALIDADGRVSGIHSVGHDIQMHVDAERAVQKSEARYRFLAENSSDMILLVGPDGKRLTPPRPAENCWVTTPKRRSPCGSRTPSIPTTRPACCPCWRPAPATPC